MNIVLTGADGLLGQAIKKVCNNHNLICISHEYNDLRVQPDVEEIFTNCKPDYVIHAAARVSGVKGNILLPGELFYENILINSHMIHYAAKYGIKKFINFSSLCVFSASIHNNCWKISEKFLHAGPPPDGHFAYAYAKRMADVQISAYKKQYGIKNFCSILPGSLFGEADSYNLEYGHVIPSLIHKIYLAKQDNTPLEVWGDGSVSREFLYSQDLATMVMQLLELDDLPQNIIASSKEEYTIKHIVETLCRVADFQGEVKWLLDKPKGQNCRRSSTELLNSLIKVEYTELEQALSNSYKWFEQHYPKLRM